MLPSTISIRESAIQKQEANFSANSEGSRPSRTTTEASICGLNNRGSLELGVCSGGTVHLKCLRESQQGGEGVRGQGKIRHRYWGENKST